VVFVNKACMKYVYFHCNDYGYYSVELDLDGTKESFGIEIMGCEGEILNRDSVVRS
jgi:hypothetical protein